MSNKNRRENILSHTLWKYFLRPFHWVKDVTSQSLCWDSPGSHSPTRTDGRVCNAEGSHFFQTEAPITVKTGKEIGKSSCTQCY